MSIRNAGAVIREARERAGLSRERLSKGICNENSLLRIEKGMAGISPSTFQKLMERAGANGNAFPVFVNKEEYQVFRNMLDIKYYLDCWQLDDAHQRILEVEEVNYADNKFYYQQCQLYKGLLLLKSHTCDYKEVEELLWEAFHVTYPQFLWDDFQNHLFSITEVELLIALAECLTYLEKPEEALTVAEEIVRYLDSTQISYQEKSSLKAKSTIAMAKALIGRNRYEEAYERAENMRKISVSYSDYPVLHELTFLTGICRYYMGEEEAAYRLFERCYYSAYSANSVYASIIHDWTAKKLGIKWKEDIETLPMLPMKTYHYEPVTKIPEGNGIYDSDIDSIFLYHLGDIIRDTRKKKRISQVQLSKGLCSRSALSKIENNIMYPDKFLAEALLQRLGIYSDAFMMFGDAKDFQIAELKKEITARAIRNENGEVAELITKLEMLLPKKDVINRQFSAFITIITSMATSAVDKAEELKAVLSYTVDSFEFGKIQQYCLSYNELTILNNLAQITIEKDPSAGIQMLYEILRYHACKGYDILEKNRTYVITIYSLFKNLYKAKRFKEMQELISEITSITHGYFYSIIGRIYFFYSQTLGEMHLFDEVCFYARCSCCNQELLGNFCNSELLKKYLYEDFGIKLD